MRHTTALSFTIPCDGTAVTPNGDEVPPPGSVREDPGRGISRDTGRPLLPCGGRDTPHVPAQGGGRGGNLGTPGPSGGFGGFGIDQLLDSPHVLCIDSPHNMIRPPVAPSGPTGRHRRRCPMPRLIPPQCHNTDRRRAGGSADGSAGMGADHRDDSDMAWGGLYHADSGNDQRQPGMVGYLFSGLDASD